MKGFGPGQYIVSIGQVVDDEDEFITLKVGKSEQTRFDLEEGDRFVTLVFTNTDDNGLQVLPWD